MINDVCIIIPAYNPNEELFIKFINELIQKFSNILVVNDGSEIDYNDTFEKIKQLNIKILKHNVNLGKGRALKTAFNEVLNNYHNCIGCICVDCDGQHLVQDVLRCYRKFKENNNDLILGARNFNQKDVPPKSKFGNNLTRDIFKLFIGIKIRDTQTGLRAMSTSLMKKFMNVKGERYEFETNMLIECKNEGIKISEVLIKTIYIEKNKTSHFNPIKDSFSIYKMFAKYILSAMSSFLIDIILFNFTLILINKWNITNKIIISTIIARTISSICNYKLNQKVVFKNIDKKSFIKYAILVIIQMFMSAFMVEYIGNIIKINPVIIKIFVDSIIFIVNFVIQREVIFKK